MAEPAIRMEPVDAGGGRTPAAPSWRQLIGIPLNVMMFLLLMVMGWGSWSGFFAHPVRMGVVVLHLIMIPVMTWSTSGRSRGLKSAPDWRSEERRVGKEGRR